MEKETRNVVMDGELYPTEGTVDPFELLGVLARHWTRILLCFLIGVLAAGGFTHFCMTPVYKAKSMIYIYSKTTSVTSLADLQIGTQLAVDFQIVASTREVMNEVIEKLGLDMTYEELSKIVEVTTPKSSHILKIQVTSSDPELAARISNTLADELRMRIADVMNTDEPSMVERAVVPKKKAGPSTVRNAAIGGVILAFLAMLAYIIAFMRDDTIKDADDVKRYLRLNVLASIPAERAVPRSKD